MLLKAEVRVVSKDKLKEEVWVFQVSETRIILTRYVHLFRNHKDDDWEYKKDFPGISHHSIKRDQVPLPNDVIIDAKNKLQRLIAEMEVG